VLNFEGQPGAVGSPSDSWSVCREYEPYHRLPLFHWEWNVTLIAG